MKNFFMIVPIILSLFASHALNAASQGDLPMIAKTPEERIVGKWVMHLYIGTQLFDDEVSINRDESGNFQGTLTVPGRFTAAIKDVTAAENAFKFRIEADEGRGPFTVWYEGSFHPDRDVFIGFATVVQGQARNLLGGFVGDRL